MSKIIYVVTSGSYSDYGIRAMFTKKDDADELAKQYGHDDGRVEEWELDKPLPYPKGMLRFQVIFDQKGNTGVYETSPEEGEDKTYPYGYQIRGMRRDDTMQTKCWAKDREHAVKIANERRVQIIAAGEWESDWENYRDKKKLKEQK